MRKIKTRLIAAVVLALLLGGLAFGLIRRQQILHTEPIVWYPSVRVFETHNGYKVYFLEGEHIQGSLYFSKDRQLKEHWNVNAIGSENAAVFFGKSLEEITKEYGDPHADIGSGFYIPAYVSEDAHLVVLYMENNTVYKVTVKDLITDTVVATD